MRVIRDADTIEFKDDSGDKLILRVAPRQRDIEACDELETDEAMKAVARLKTTGFDTDSAMEAAIAEAQKETPEAVAEAEAKVSSASPAVRRFRLARLAVRLVIDGENIGGESILTTYGDMSRESAEWVDEQVEKVWTGAQVNEVEAFTPAD